MNPAGPATTPDGEPSDSKIPVGASDFDSTLRAYAAGDTALAELRKQLSDALMESPGAVSAITATLDGAKESSDLSTAIYRLLLRDIKHITTEETPTDRNAKGEIREPGARQPDRSVESDRPDTSALSSKAAPRGPFEPSPERVTPQPSRRPPPAEPVKRPAPRVTGDAASPHAGPEVGDVLRDRYELRDKIAEGPMGVLFRATDQLKAGAGGHATDVAIKVLNADNLRSPEALRRLTLEASNAQRLAHPNIVNVFELDQHAGHYFISMEWLDGESLAARLDKTRPQPMSKPEFEWIFRDLAQALQYAHERGVVHGDVKPGNVFLTADNEVKLIDFGLARRSGDAGAGAENDEPYGLTQSYASCEVLSGQEPNVQDDVFALSLLAYRMLSGHRPFGAGNVLHAEADSLKPERPPEITDDQWSTLIQGMAFRRGDRLLTVADLVEGLVAREVRAAEKSPRVWPWAAVASVLGFVGGVWLAEPVLEQTEALRAEYFGRPSAAPVVEWPQPKTGQPSSDPPATPVVDDPTADAVSTTLSESRDTAPAVPERELELLTEDSPDAIAPTVYLDSESEPASVAESAPADTTPVPVEASPLPPAPVEPAESSDSVQTAAEYRPSQPLGFVQEQYTVNEGDGFVRLGIGSPSSLTRPVTLRVVVQEGTAIPGEDFAVPAVETVVVDPGADAAEVFVPLIADAEQEFIEDFVVRLISLDDEYQVENGAVIIIILDDDGIDQTELTAG